MWGRGRRDERSGENPQARDDVEVVVFEKGNDVSFANCGMPYYIGGVIHDRENMLVQTPKALADRYDIDVRVRHEVTRIDRESKTVSVKNHDSGETFEEAYDHLILAPVVGADGVKTLIDTYCAVGLRGYLAYRFLEQKGFDVKNLNGGYRTWTWFQ